MKRAGWLAIASSLLLGFQAAAEAGGGALGRPRLQIVSPAAGEAIETGSRMDLAWRSARGSEEFEEWEAFLSLDDGRSFPVRLTPHLDSRVGRFEWTVPELPTATARILLRWGDEAGEESQLGERFEIRLSRDRIFSPPTFPSLARGESALALDRAGRAGSADGVATWVDGDRAGGDQRAYAALSGEVGICGVELAKPSRTGRLALSVSPALPGPQFFPVARARESFHRADGLGRNESGPEKNVRLAIHRYNC